MKTSFLFSVLSAFAFSACAATNAGAQESQTKAPPPVISNQFQGILSGAVKSPSKQSVAGSSQFTPTSEKLLFLDDTLSKGKMNASQKTAFRAYAAQMMTMVEDAYTKYGFQKNDMGAAFGALLETCYEMDRGTYKVGESTEKEKEQTRAVVRQMQNAFGSSKAFQALPNRSKQIAYESASFLTGNLALQWQQAEGDAAKENVVRKRARQQIQTLFQLDPDGIARLASGEFAAKRGLVASVSATKSASAAASTPKTKAASVGPLPAPSLGGTRIFVKYRLHYSTFTETKFDHLILFPDGTAFDDIPSKPMPQFSAATLKAMLKPFYVGTWKQNGNTLVLNFPASKSEPRRVLLKCPDGWYDGKSLPKESTAYDTYYPVIPATKKHLVGVWKSSSLTTMGTMGGGTAMVAAGSNSNIVFRADGMFADSKKSFASATTANMGDAFKSGGDVTTTSNKSKAGVGQWRIDGPLLTMQRNGERTVHIAFIMPHWSKDPKSQSDVMIDGDNWEHPEK